MIGNVASTIFETNFITPSNAFYDTRSVSFYSTVGRFKFDISFTVKKPANEFLAVQLVIDTNTVVANAFSDTTSYELISTDVATVTSCITANFPAGVKRVRIIALISEDDTISGTVCIRRLEETSSAMYGPFGVHYLDGAFQGTSLSIQGCINYEVIPNAALI